MWFELLTGFREDSPETVHKNILIDGDKLIFQRNRRECVYGTLDIPSLAELRERIRSENIPQGKISVREVVEDVQGLHIDSANAGSIFQVASQFNLLEMVSPDIVPEQGVDIYEQDHTQGPSCAVAAGAGTIFRNYFVEVNGQIGQSADNQIDCLREIGEALGNSCNDLWVMKNGYALLSQEGLIQIARKLKSCNRSELDNLRSLLHVGIQWNTQVTLANSVHCVSQVYCSALPVAYSDHSLELWEEFARLILEASYEATLCAGILNYIRTGKNTLYLTLIGAGAFGNKPEWIINALKRALKLHRNVNLDIAIVSHKRPNTYVGELVHLFQSEEKN